VPRSMAMSLEIAPKMLENMGLGYRSFGP